MDLSVVTRAGRRGDAEARARVVRHGRLPHRTPHGRPRAHRRRRIVHHANHRRAGQDTRHRSPTHRRRWIFARRSRRADRRVTVPETARWHPRDVHVPADARRLPGEDERSPDEDAAVPGARQGRRRARDGVLLRHQG